MKLLELVVNQYPEFCDIFMAMAATNPRVVYGDEAWDEFDLLRLEGNGRRCNAGITPKQSSLPDPIKSNKSAPGEKQQSPLIKTNATTKTATVQQVVDTATAGQSSKPLAAKAKRKKERKNERKKENYTWEQHAF